MKSRVLLIIAAAATAAAQENAPLRLTLPGAVTMALRQNPQVILANLNVAQSEQDRNLARAGLLPQVTGNVSEAVHRVNIQAAIGITIPGFAQHVGPYYTFQSGAAFSAPVFDLTLWNRYRSSRIGIDSARSQEQAAREESVMLVVSQYLGAQRAAADVEAAQSRVELAQALYGQAADLQKNGAGTAIDTLRANVQLQNEKQRLIVARTSLDTSLFGLARLLNIDPHRPIELADQVSFFETPAAAADSSIERAYSTRPEMKRIQADEQRAALDRKTAGQQRVPKLSVSGGWLEQGLSPASAIPVYQYEASLDFPIFTGGRIQAEQAKTDIALRQLKQQEQELRNRIALEVKTAAANVDSARGEVEVARQGIDLARQEVGQARDRFQAGVANNIEVITAQDELARASDNQIAALYRYNQARADLAYASGQMETLYAK
jgi:outer membrane protein TolC